MAAWPIHAVHEATWNRPNLEGFHGGQEILMLMWHLAVPDLAQVVNDVTAYSLEPRLTEADPSRE